jgi:hypothetical protein
MDLDRGLCKGCLRTLDEIGRWSQMSDAEQAAVLERLEQRRLEFPEIAVPPLA